MGAAGGGPIRDGAHEEGKEDGGDFDSPPSVVYVTSPPPKKNWVKHTQKVLRVNLPDSGWGRGTMHPKKPHRGLFSEEKCSFIRLHRYVSWN